MVSKSKKQQNLEEFLNRIQEIGKAFNPGLFRKEASEFLDGIKPEIERNKIKIPSYETFYSQATQLLANLSSLTPLYLNTLGGYVVSLEQSPGECPDLTKGIGIKAIARALTLNPKLGTAYANLATIADMNRTPILTRDQIKSLYHKAISCPDPQNQLQKDLKEEQPWIFE